MDPTPSIPWREQQRLLTQELRAADAGTADGSFAEYYAQEQAQARRASLTGKNPSAKAAGVTLARLGAAAGLIIALLLPTVGNGQDVPAKAAKTVLMRVTFYCKCEKCCGRHACGITASGRAAVGAIAAVDPRFIRLGSMVSVPGFGWMLAADTGRVIKGRNQLDVLRSSHAEAKALGVRWLPVEIVTPREYQRRLEAALFQLRFDELVRESRRLATSQPNFTGARSVAAVSNHPPQVSGARPVIQP